MANIYKMKNAYNGVGSIQLSNLLFIEEGLVNNSSPSLDITTGGDKLIFTAPASGIIGIDLSDIKLIQAGANTTGSLIASFGTNSPNYDNIVAPVTFTGMNSIGDAWTIQIDSLNHRIAAGEALYMRVTNPVAGSGAILSAICSGRIVV